MMEGSRRVALDVVLDLSEVVLMTEVGVGQRGRGAGGEGGGRQGVVLDFRKPREPETLNPQTLRPVHPETLSPQTLRPVHPYTLNTQTRKP